jgi:hypothetical protein
LVDAKCSKKKRRYLAVDFELISEDLVSDFVDGVCLLAIVLLTSVHWAPLAVPDTETMLVHPLTFLLVASPQTTLLLGSAGVKFGGFWETKEGVVMDGVSSVVPVFVCITKVREVGCEGVAIKEDDMIGILGTNNGVKLVVEFDDASVLRVGGLVEGVVTGNPLVTPVMLSKLSPEPEDTVLIVLVVPYYDRISAPLKFQKSRYNLRLAMWLP